MRQRLWPVPSLPCSSRFPTLDCRTTWASLLVFCFTLGQVISCRKHTATRVALSPWPSRWWVSFSLLSSRASSKQGRSRSNICTALVFTNWPTLFLTPRVYAMQRIRLYRAILAPLEQGQEAAFVKRISYMKETLYAMGCCYSRVFGLRRRVCGSVYHRPGCRCHRQLAKRAAWRSRRSGDACSTGGDSGDRTCPVGSA